MFEDPIALKRERQAIVAQADAIVATVERHGRDKMSSGEQTRFDAFMTEIRALDDRILDAEEAQQRRTAADAIRAQSTANRTERAGGFVHTDGGRTYSQDDHRTSWVRDMATVALNREGADEARDRLHRNNQEARVELRAMSTTDGAGGDFVPPVWLVNQFINLSRAARPTADRVQNQPMPSGTDTINVPRLVTGTAVAEQTNQNTTIQNTDATTGSVSAAVATLAGSQTIAVQMLEQSPINVDDMLLSDLLADYATKVDVFVLNNNAAGKYGILNTPGILTQPYTDAAPTTAKLFMQLAQAISQVQQTRFQTPDTILMHPRRWAAFLSAMDSSNRPLVSASAGAMNPLGTAGEPAASGVVGQLQGLAVITDPMIPTNIGAGSNQDPVIVMRAGDYVLYEGAPRAEAFRDTKADTLSVFLRVYNYVAVLSRFPKSICVVSGTGLVPPTYGS